MWASRSKVFDLRTLGLSPQWAVEHIHERTVPFEDPIDHGRLGGSPVEAEQEEALPSLGGCRSSPLHTTTRPKC